MCFRPPSIAAKIPCPECGTDNATTATTCFRCGAEMPQQEGSPDAGIGIGIAPPMSPAAPSAPAAPGAPKA